MKVTINKNMNYSTMTFTLRGWEPGTKISIINSILNKRPDPHTLRHGIH